MHQVHPQPSKAVFRTSCHGDSDPSFYWRPFSNIPARHVLDSLFTDQVTGSPATASALFLGCNDPRTIIRSLASLLPKSGKNNQPVQLTAVVNDIHPPTLARTVLLLFMAAKLDPDKKADMQLLFDVWFNTIWHPDTWPRFAVFVQALLDNKVSWIQPARPEDLHKVEEVWRWWLDEKHPKRPTPFNLLNARDAFRQARRTHEIYRQPPEPFPVNDTPCYADHLAHSVWNPLESHFFSIDNSQFPKADSWLGEAQWERAFAMYEGIRLSYKDYVETGSVGWDQTSRKGTSGRTVNITFVEPGTGAWNMHPDIQPFTCFGTYSTSELVAAAFQREGGAEVVRTECMLARALITRMASVLKDFKQNTAFGHGRTTHQRVALHVEVLCGESLSLCLNSCFDAPRPMVPKGTRDGTTHEWSNSPIPWVELPAPTEEPTFPTFDIIDTGSLCDDVGLLPLLVAVTPRLSNDPAARLHTVPATWALGAPRMDYYLQEQALGMPLTMTPTLLGLRLITDILYGRPAAHTISLIGADSFDPRHLIWAPVPPSQPLPQLHLPTAKSLRAGGAWGPEGSLAAVLQKVSQLCCTNDHTKAPHNCADMIVNLSTPQTFAWMLVSCISRIDMGSLVHAVLGPTGSIPPLPSTIQQDDIVTLHRTLWGLRNTVSALLPSHFRVAFQGAIDAVRASLQSATNEEGVKKAGVPKCTSQSVLLVPINSGYQRLHCKSDVRLRRPYLRAVLDVGKDKVLGKVDDSDDETNWREASPAVKAAVKGYAYGGKADTASKGVQVLDCCGLTRSPFGDDGLVAVFLLPDRGDGSNVAIAKTTSMLYSNRTGCEVSAAQTTSSMDSPADLLLPYLARTLLRPLLNPGPWTGMSSTTSSSSKAPRSKARKAPGPTLEVDSMIEVVDSYKVLLKVLNAGDAPGTFVKVQFVESHLDPKIARVVQTSHDVDVALIGPSGVSMQLRLAWPVSAGASLGENEKLVPGCYSSGYGVKATPIPNTGLMSILLRKAHVWERWPGDRPTPKHIATLPHTSLQRINYLMCEEAMSVADIGILESNSEENALKAFVKLAGRMWERDDDLFIHVKSKEKKFAGEYDLIVVLSKETYYIDGENEHSFVIPACSVDMRLMDSEGKLPPIHNLFTGLRRGEKPLQLLVPEEDACAIRRYLWHNSRYWEPVDWQSAFLWPLLQGGNLLPVMIGFATYISPVFVEHMQRSAHAQRLFAKLFPAGVPPVGKPLPYPLPPPSIVSEATQKSVPEAPPSPATTASTSQKRMPAPQVQVSPQEKAKGSAFAFKFGGSSSSKAVRGSSSSNDGAAAAASAAPVTNAADSSAAAALQSAEKSGNTAAADTTAAAAMQSTEQSTGQSGNTSHKSIQLDETEQEELEWMCEKMMQLKAAFPHCTHEELGEMAEVACAAYLRNKAAGAGSNKPTAAAAASTDKQGDNGSVDSAPKQQQQDLQAEQDQQEKQQATCSCCGKSGLKLMGCGGCGQVSYCGVACQKADWKKHKKQCRAKS